jgi:hypothetical protein
MKSYTTARFRRLLSNLPADVQRSAKKAFRIWLANSGHPSLEFKKLQGTKTPTYSARVGIHWRVVAARSGDDYVWLWIGSHSDYDKVVASL